MTVRRGGDPAARAELEVYGTKEAADTLRQVGDRAADMKPAMQRVFDIMEEGIRKQFESKGAHLGTPWPELAKSTVERKARAGLSSEPLVGATRHPADVAYRWTRPGEVCDQDWLELARRTSWHTFQQGGSKGPGSHTIPARKVVGVAKEDSSRIFATIRSYLSTGRL